MSEILTKCLLSNDKLELIFKRFSVQIIENHPNINNLMLVGIQPRGVELCTQIVRNIKERFDIDIEMGVLDISLHRDDIHLNENVVELNPNSIPFSIENKDIVLVDDVLYSGRTIRAALDALVQYGRPKDIELLVLIDRKLHRNMPIQAKYVGMTIDSVNSEKVIVALDILNKNSKVDIIANI